MKENYVFTQTPEEIQGILNRVPTMEQQIEGLQQNVGTLNEAVGNLGESVTQLQETKVEKVEGKQLSTEDFSSEDKAKLEALPTNAELQSEYASQTEVDGIDERLEVVEQLAQISVSGGSIGIATPSDFDNPIPEQAAKVPTVGAILGSMDIMPKFESVKPVQSGGVAASLGELGWLYFEKGGISGDGNNMTHPYRARSTYFKIPVGTRIEVGEVNGVACSIIVFEYDAPEGQMVAKSHGGAWSQSAITTSAEWVRITFKFDDSDTHSVSDFDLPLIKSALTFVSSIEQRAIQSVWTDSDFEQGGYDSSGNKSNNLIRIRTKERKAFKAGDKLFVSLGASQVAVIGVYYNNTYTYTTYTQNSEVTFENDCEAVVIVRWEDASQQITVADNDCAFLVNAQYAKNVQVEMNDMEARLQAEIDNCEKKFSYTFKSSDFEQGNYSANGDKMTGSTRIRTKNRRAAHKGDVIYVNASDAKAVKIGYFVTADGVETYTVGKDFTAGDYLYKVEQDCEIVFIVRNNPDGTAIRPADYDCLIVQFSTVLMDEICDLREDVDGLQNPDIVVRNAERNNMLVATSRNGKNFQLCLASDVHNDQPRFRNAALATEGFSTIKCLLALGDMVYDNMYVRSNADFIYSLTEDMQKPFLMVLGNHDVGNCAYIPYTVNQAQSYEIFMTPFHVRGILNDIENPSGTCYWYKDFDAYKLRLIGLNCYDEDVQFDETNWRPVAYDSSYAMIQKNTAYSIGDRVNVQNFTDYSFEAVQSITTDALGVTTTKGPSYKCKRGIFVIGEAQANWFAGKLATVPEGYGVVVALHGTFSSQAHNQSSFKFADEAGGDRWANPGSHYMMATDFLAEIVEAYKNRGVYNKDIVMNGTAAYMNTQGGGTYAYHISKDFSNAKGTFMCWLGGHWHADLIWKHDNFNQYQIAPTWTNQRDWTAYQPTDIIVSQENNVSNDCLTNVAFDVDANKIGLVKIGQNITTFAKKRDVEVINLV